MNVYLIHQEDSDLYKIGVSKRVNKRLKENQTGNGTKLEIIAVFPTEIPYKIENIIHRKWQHKRKEGEWFELDYNDVNSFETVCREIENNLNYLSKHNTWVQSVKHPF